jgi:hypothetical protein
MTTTEEFQAVKLSLRLDALIHAALQKEGQAKGREIGEHIQRILTEHAIHQKLLDDATGMEYKMMWSLVHRAVETARRICRDGGFATDITLKTFQKCMEDKLWAAEYESYVKDNPYKHGNPRKSPINKEIGFRIREGIGGKVVKLSNGKPAKTPVVGEIIQSYTPMGSFNSDAVKAIA